MAMENPIKIIAFIAINFHMGYAVSCNIAGYPNIFKTLAHQSGRFAFNHHSTFALNVQGLPTLNLKAFFFQNYFFDKTHLCAAASIDQT